MLRLPDDFQAAVLPPNRTDQSPARWLIFANGQLLVRTAQEGLELPQASIWPFAKWTTRRRLYLGTWRGQPYYAAEAATADPPPGWRFDSLRSLWRGLEEGLLGIASQAAQLVEWDRTHQFCGHCGTPTQAQVEERARRCPTCELLVYPRLSPVAMVRVVDAAGRILLARAPRFALGVYSVLAGFVEAGETLEQAIYREVAEEVGIQVCNLRYFASQSWPFPHSLVIAFTADYAGGHIQVDGRELLDARWFTPEELPELPSPMSIARRLIEDYRQQRGTPA